MARNLILFLLAVGIFVVGKEACSFNMFSWDAETGKGPIREETRTLASFSGIHSHVPANIEVFHSTENKIVVSMQESLLPLFESEVSGSQLDLDFSKRVHTDKPIQIKIYTSDLAEIDLTGAGKMKVSDAFGGSMLEIDISGVSDVDFAEARYDRIGCQVSGSGSVKIQGSAQDLDASVSGVGSIYAAGLEVKNCTADISGSGKVECYPVEYLKAQVSGVGNIRYKGQPHVDSEVSGAGSIKRLEE